MNYAYILRRLFLAVFVVMGVTLVTFLIIQLVPGDPARLALGVQATDDLVAVRRAQLGLDRPFLEQYGSWLVNVVQGDLGRSLITGQPITPQVMGRLPATIQLAGMAVVIGMLIAFPLGIISALRPGSIADTIASILSQLGIAVPDFWMGILLVLLFSSTLGWLPPSGYTPISQDFGGWLGHMILPATTAGLISGAIQTRFVRSAMLEVLNQNYIQTARAKGLHEMTVITRHALRNAMITIVTIVGLQVTALLSAVVVIEIVFVLPGLGRLALDAVLARDYTLVRAAVFVMAILVTFINLVVDLLYFLLDPRLEHA
jgi:peptide/nickel transport system permease protein